ncbi:MAG: enoyl-CoA hydratase/isomerase family protein [Myxococcota bacterium]
MHPPRFDAAELIRFLVDPSAAESLSPATEGPGVVVLDLAATPAEAARLAEAELLEALPILPCVTIAVGADPDDLAGRALAQICDVQVDSDESLSILLAGFEATPLAALAFAQLLRGAPRASVHAGLVAESFVYSTLQAGPEFAAWRADWEARRGRKGRKGRTVRAGRAGAKRVGALGASPQDAAEPACRLAREGDELSLTLSRPEKHNAFSAAMRDGVAEGLAVALADPGIQEVVLRGEGTSFCSGGDLDEFGSFPDPARAHVIRTTRSPALLLARLASRVRCEVQGACVGAGVELPAFTGRVIASEDAFFQLPEVALGLVPGAGGTVSLPARIGRQRTAWLGLSGRRIDAQTALDWGLVDELRLGQHVTRR